MKFHFGKDAYMITQLGQKQVFFPCAISAILDVADGSSELSVYAYCMCCVQCAVCTVFRSPFWCCINFPIVQTASNDIISHIAGRQESSPISHPIIDLQLTALYIPRICNNLQLNAII